MTKTDKFKQNIILFSTILSFIISFAAVIAAAAFFWHEEQQDSQSAVQPALPPLIVEPNRVDFQVDFQGEGKGEEKKHETIVHLMNQSDRKISLLFTHSSCRCSLAELPGDTILPGEKLPVKCTLSTAGRISDRAGGEIWIAYRFADSGENTSPMYVRVILTAVIDSVSAGKSDPPLRENET